MLDYQDINKLFTSNLGYIKVLSREEEKFLFVALSITILRAYWKMLDLGISLEEEYLIPNVDVLHVERQYGSIYQLVKEHHQQFPQLWDRLVLIYNTLMKHNLRLIMSISKKKYMRDSKEMMHLILEGKEGLDITTGKFNINKKCKLSTYSIHWIKQGLYRYVNDYNKPVKLPMHIVSALKKSSELFQSCIDDQESSKERKLRRIFYVPKRKVFLDYVSQDKDKESPALQESLADTSLENLREFSEHKRVHEQVSNLLANLSPIRERYIRYRFGLGTIKKYSLEMTSDLSNLSIAKLRKIEHKLLSKLKLSI